MPEIDSLSIWRRFPAGFVVGRCRRCHGQRLDLAAKPGRRRDRGGESRLGSRTFKVSVGLRVAYLYAQALDLPICTELPGGAIFVRGGRELVGVIEL